MAKEKKEKKVIVKETVKEKVTTTKAVKLKPNEKMSGSCKIVKATKRGGK